MLLINLKKISAASSELEIVLDGIGGVILNTVETELIYQSATATRLPQRGRLSREGEGNTAGMLSNFSVRLYKLPFC